MNEYMMIAVVAVAIVMVKRSLAAKEEGDKKQPTRLGKSEKLNDADSQNKDNSRGQDSDNPNRRLKK